MGAVVSSPKQEQKQQEQHDEMFLLSSKDCSNSNSNSTRASTTTTTGSSVSVPLSSANQYIRKAYHAGAWYDDNPIQLSATIKQYLDKVIGKQQEDLSSSSLSAVAIKGNDSDSIKSKQVKPNKNENNTTTGRENDDDNKDTRTVLRGIICPHAGYRFSAYTAAHSFKELYNELCYTHTYTPTPIPTTDTTSDNSNNSSSQQHNSPIIKHIIILHPSHHKHIDGYCLVSNASLYETPMGNLYADDEIRNELLALNNVHSNTNNNTNKYTPTRTRKNTVVFDLLSQKVDEEEHGAEMMYPFLYYILNETNTVHSIKVLGIMCGSLTYNDEQYYGSILSPILSRPDVFTILSSDFCHWGQRFRYTPTTNTIHYPIQNTQTIQKQQQQQQQQQQIYQYIESLDKTGMDYIQQKDAHQFHKYITETNNTICGRHAISIYLHSIQQQQQQRQRNLKNVDTEQNLDSCNINNNVNSIVQIQFLHYAQSSQVKSIKDSSVSYAAGVMYQ